MEVYVNNKYQYNVGIRSTGIYIGDHAISNHDLAKISDTSDEWIRSHTGIRQRFIVDERMSTSDLLVPAGKMALERADLTPDEIDLVIVATFSPDNLDPATSALIQAKLGLSKAFSFDLNVGGCSSSIYGPVLAAQFIMSGQCKNVLVLVGDVISKFINWQDRTSNYFFGDAAGAYVLSRTHKDKGLIAYHLGTDGTGYENIIIPAGGSRMPCTHQALDEKLNSVKIAGKKVKEFAVPALCRAVQRVLACAGLSPAEIDWILPHQANYILIQEAFKEMNWPLEKTHSNIDKYGNTGGASVILALHEAVELKKVKPGQNVVLVSFGAGYQWGSICLNWCEPNDFYA